MVAGLKMDWIFKKPARLSRPSDEGFHGLNTMSPLLGEAAGLFDDLSQALKACHGFVDWLSFLHCARVC